MDKKEMLTEQDLISLGVTPSEIKESKKLFSGERTWRIPFEKPDAVGVLEQIKSGGWSKFW